MKKPRRGARIHENYKPTTGKRFWYDRQKFKMTMYGTQDIAHDVDSKAGDRVVGSAIDLNYLNQNAGNPNRAQPWPDTCFEYMGTTASVSSSALGSLQGWTDFIRVQGASATPNYLSCYVSSVTVEWGCQYITSGNDGTAIPTTTLPVQFFTVPISYEQLVGMRTVTTPTTTHSYYPVVSTGTTDDAEGQIAWIRQMPGAQVKSVQMNPYMKSRYFTKRHITLKRLMPPGYPHTNPMPQTLVSSATRTHYHILQGTNITSPTDGWSGYLYMGYGIPAYATQTSVAPAQIMFRHSFKVTVWFTCVLPLIMPVGFHLKDGDGEGRLVIKSGESKLLDKKDDEKDDWTEDDVKQFAALMGKVKKVEEPKEVPKDLKVEVKEDKKLEVPPTPRPEEKKKLVSTKQK